MLSKSYRTILLLILVGLAGCASNEKARLMDASMRQYDAAVRWGDFRLAVGYLDPESRPEDRQLEFELERFEQVRVSGYRPLALNPGPDADTAERVMELRIVNRHTASERVIQERQTWRYDPEAERWWLTTGLPDIGRR